MTPDELRAAVKKVGTSAEAVRAGIESGIDHLTRSRLDFRRFRGMDIDPYCLPISITTSRKLLAFQNSAFPIVAH